MFWRYLFIILLVFAIFLNPGSVFAESSYVLPYPSAMPGSIFYKLNLIQEEFLKYWYFGDFAQFKYNLAESDKYLVEAKTLFDYKQYLLGYLALQKSNSYYKKIKPALISAENNKKEIKDKVDILFSASQKHIEELSGMRDRVPAAFNWSPEKQKPQQLDLRNLINQSIEIRLDGI